MSRSAKARLGGLAEHDAAENFVLATPPLCSAQLVSFPLRERLVEFGTSSYAVNPPKPGSKAKRPPGSLSERWQQVISFLILLDRI